MSDLSKMRELAEKWLKGTITEEEKAIFEAWYNSGHEELISWSGDKSESELQQRLLQSILTKIEQEGLESNKVNILQQHTNRNRIFRFAAAAAIIICIMVGGIFILNRRDKNSIATGKSPAQNDLPPGRDAAVLTLGNGRKIILDSTSGTISKQQGITVINVSGLLTYKTSGHEAYPLEVNYNTITTARGNQYQLVLGDGSRVWLNSASSLRFPTVFTGTERVVDLTGEAYFEVVPMTTSAAGKPGNVPFTVNINTSTGNKGVVRVLGTHFNINAYEDEEILKTTLLEGSVKVSNKLAARIIKPAEQAQLFNTLSADGNIVIQKDVDVDQVMAWKTGFFEFDKTDLPTIMRQISRWYDVELVYEGKPGDEKFGGRIGRNLNLSNVLRMLQANGVRFRLEGKKLIIQP